MFDFFDNIFSRRKYSTETDKSDLEKVSDDMNKVIKFPLKTLPAMPEVEQPKQEPGRVFYRLGLTDNNRVAISMYYGEITMNSAAVQKLIDQLEFYKSQLTEDEAE
jgi:hypothetical protein